MCIVFIVVVDLRIVDYFYDENNWQELVGVVTSKHEFWYDHSGSMAILSWVSH